MINILVTSTDCANPALATSLTVVKRFLAIIQIVGPILLILSLGISFFRNTLNPDDKNSIKRIVNSIIAIILLFLIPMFINAIMGVLGENFTVSECWNSIENISNDRNPSYQNPYENKDKVNIYDDTKKYDKSNKATDDNNSTEDTNNNNDTNNNENNNDSNNNSPTKGKTIVEEPKL